MGIFTLALCVLAVVHGMAQDVTSPVSGAALVHEVSSTLAEDSVDDTATQRSFLATVFFESPLPGSDSRCAPWQIARKDQCTYIRDHSELCGGGHGAAFYLGIYYCRFNGWAVLGNLALLLWICVQLVILLLVASHFFCPALEVLADLLKMPPNVAGATLLSIGNGAPDFFTQLAALATRDESSLQIALGEPLGGGVFAGNVTLAAVIWFGSSGPAGVKVEPAAFFRDACFLSGAIALISLVCYDNRVTVLEAVAMIAYYLLFVIYIACFDLAGSRGGAAALQLQDSLHYQAVMRHVHSHGAVASPSPHHHPSSSAALLEAAAPSSLGAPDRKQQQQHGGTCARRVPSGHGARSQSPSAAGGEGEREAAPGGSRGGCPACVDTCLSGRTLFTDAAGDSSAAPLLPPSSGAAAAAAIGDSALSLHGSGDRGGGEPSCVLCDAAPRSAFGVATLPILWLLRLTMPEVGMGDEVCYPRIYAALLPICCPLFITMAKGLAFRATSPLNGDAVLYGLTCGVFSSFVIVSIYPKDGRHYGALSAFFTALTFGMAILWMDVAAGELVKACKAFGYIFGLSQSALGVTVLAWGNSFGDLVSNASMARDGFPSMSVAACFASPLFTTMAALGSGFLVMALRHGTLRIAMDLPLRLALGFAFVSVTRYLVLIPCVFKWRLTWKASVQMIAFYALFQMAYLWSITRSTGTAS